MVAHGLLPELRTFYTEFNKLSHHTDYTKGILQTIGFKEFIPYLEQIADASQDSSELAQALLQQCLAQLKLVTRRYSKRQKKWVQNRMLYAADSRPVPAIYSLDTTDATTWNSSVYEPAVDLISHYIRGNEVNATLKPMKATPSGREGLDENVSMHCTTCDRIFVGEYQWNEHMKSNRHKKRLAGMHKKEKLSAKKVKKDPTLL